MIVFAEALHVRQTIEKTGKMFNSKESNNMERKIGETFEFEGKTYKVVKFNGCRNCAFRYNDCPNLTPVIGNCMDLVRSDGVKVMFEETENMEIKDNKLTIDIPEGMEIDLLNSNFGTGVICFKKKKPEFKDGDILLYKSAKFTFFSSIFILKTNRNEMRSYVRFSIGKGSIDYDVPVVCNLGTDRYRYATEEEKQQLFSALAKKGKAWDAEKKQVVDLKPKVELKPFDKVLVRDDEDHAWQVSLFGYKDATNYRCNNGCSLNQCIPYFGNENLLGTTKDVEG